MLAKLTLRLLASPEQAWLHFAAAHSAAPETPGSLPTPLQHVVAAGFVSVFATGFGWMLRPGATSGGAVLQMLSATVGYVGGAALAVLLTPRLVRAPGAAAFGSHAETRASAELVSRFASGAVLPLTLSGITNVLPLPIMSLVLALAGAAASAQSAWIGASALLALEGPARTRAAAVPAGLAVSLVLLATFVRMALPT
jgi:hypothetical protein